MNPTILGLYAHGFLIRFLRVLLVFLISVQIVTVLAMTLNISTEAYC